MEYKLYLDEIIATKKKRRGKRNSEYSNKIINTVETKDLK